MSGGHGPMCLWKQTVLSRKLKRYVSMDEVHILCDYLGFSNPEETLAWIETVSEQEIERALEEAKKRKKKRRLLGDAYEWGYVYAT